MRAHVTIVLLVRGRVLTLSYIACMPAYMCVHMLACVC
jgi:hypothetical protein